MTYVVVTGVEDDGVASEAELGDSPAVLGVAGSVSLEVVDAACWAVDTAVAS